ncbi:sugar porter family MFS transporter [Sphingobacterium sp. SGG-5]|uniref:sugar porter family MFS transporter n=1 Tax=Sphingobacterium sp. SGG-5 TaxID=2710881 RepID=UPI0013EABBB3|nr:sugar porter family MFS transporter [Sphingobacterium sp. SGG-5]NGM61761.1 sugar porter family MFS transporter [Sphingobacterium sp. SGG-5]
MKSKIGFWTFIIALGGFLFGFDTAVISGGEKDIQHLWQLSSYEHGLTMSIALIGTVFGALIGGVPSDRLGRKNTLYLVALLYLVSSLATAFAQSWALFMVFRFLGGVGVGISSVVGPIYISELAPSHKRGKLVGMFQFNIVLGIVCAYLSNYMLAGIGEEAWRWMLGIMAIPSTLFLLLINFLPESPRWLWLERKNEQKVRDILKAVSPETFEQDMLRIKTASLGKEVTAVPLFQKKYFKPIILAMLFAMFNQLAGINAIIYYAPRVFELAGLGAEGSLLSTIGIGTVNFIFTLLAINVIDKYGRRTLMTIGSIGLIVCLLLVACSFFALEAGDGGVLANGVAIVIFLMFFIAFFAFSQGAVIWVFISEIFPNEIRAKGQTLGSLTHWVLAATITFVFPVLTEQIGGGYTFLVFAGFMVLQLVYVLKMMPETKGKSLEAMDTVTSIG